MLIVKTLIIIALILFFCSIFFYLSKTGTIEGAKEILENLQEAKKYFLLEQFYLKNCSSFEKQYYHSNHDGIVEFTDEFGKKRKVEFQKGIRVNEFKIDNIGCIMVHKANN